MQAEPMMSRGPFGQLLGYRKCLCPDGVRRTVRCGVPDTHSSAPARVKVRGKTVSGMLLTQYWADEVEFVAAPRGRNAAVFAGWSSGRRIPEHAPEGQWTWSHGYGCFVSLDATDYRVMDEAGKVHDNLSTLMQAQGR